jgi:dihydropteroate synthase
MLQKLLQTKMPIVMGILNLHTDSFADQGRCETVNRAVTYAMQLVAEGADIIDIGAEPTNPKQTQFKVTAAEEVAAMLPVIEGIRQQSDIPISVDTSQAEVMRATVAVGANIINDTRALRYPGALAAAIELDVPVCLMHMAYPHGLPEQAQQSSIVDVEHFLQQRLDEVITAGLKPEHIILDPGLGGGAFGKSTNTNLKLLRAIPTLNKMGFPLLIGLSRKTFIGNILNAEQQNRVHGSLALNIYAAQQGAAIIRTHDVKPLIDSLQVLKAIDSIEE